MRSGRARNGEASAHAGKVYEPIPEYTGRPSQDFVDRPVTVADLQRQAQSKKLLASTAEDGQTLEAPPTTASKRVHKLTPL